MILNVNLVLKVCGSQVLWRDEDLFIDAQPRKDYEGFVLPEASGGGGSTTSIPWEVSFGTGRPRILLTYTSPSSVLRAQSLLLEKHQEAAEDKLNEDEIPEEEKLELHRALAMCGLGEDLGSKSLIQILKQKNCTREACHIPSRFRTRLGHVQVFTQILQRAGAVMSGAGWFPYWSESRDIV